MKTQLSPIIIDILSYARLAPSVHNTQPWSFSINGLTIAISANVDRALSDGDPTQRELWISLGICLETVLLAAKALGHDAILNNTQTDTLDQPFAFITITPNTHPPQQDLIDNLKNRHSYRGPMQPVALPDSLIINCKNLINDLPGSSVWLVDKSADITTVADLTYKGMRLALSNPAFRHELANLIHYNWSSAKVGMHGFVLNRSAIGSIWEKWSIKFGLDVRKKAAADRSKIIAASGLLFIATEGDVPSYWLTAGRAYSRIAHLITRIGLAQSTIAAPVEAASFHEDIERLLKTPHRIQTMIRIGQASRPLKKVSPRLDVDELLT